MTRRAVRAPSRKRWLNGGAICISLLLHLLGNLSAAVTAAETNFSIEWTREPFEDRSAPAKTPYTQHEGQLADATNIYRERFLPSFFNGGSLRGISIETAGLTLSGNWPLITVYEHRGQTLRGGTL